MSSGISDHFSPSQATRISPTKIVLGSFVLFLCAIFFLWRGEQGRRFPAMEEGLYLGHIRTPIDTVVPIVTTVTLQPRSIRLAFLPNDADSIQGDLIERRSIYGEGEHGFLPMAIPLLGGTYWLGGREEEPGKYGGVLFDGRGRNVGAWSVVKSSRMNAKDDEHSLEKWLGIMAQLQNLKEEEATLTKTRTSLSAEIERVQNIIATPDMLAANAKMKLQSEYVLLQNSEKQYERNTKLLVQLRRQLDLTQRLSVTGRLVLLSREVLRREEPFFLKLLAPQSSEDGSS